MIPKDALYKIRSVSIRYGDCIFGLHFFDKDGALLWKMGPLCIFAEKETVLLEENEVIVGVAAKLSNYSRSAYTNF